MCDTPAGITRTSPATKSTSDPPLAEQPQLHLPARDAEHLVRSRMEMVVIVDAWVAPVVQPIVPPIAGFDGAGEIGVLIGRHSASVNEHRQAAVGHQPVGA